MDTDMITSISYSTDNGETWTTTVNQDDKEENLVIDVDVNEGDIILWKGIATQTGFHNDDNYFGSFFSSTCEFDAKGNVMSLLYGDNFKEQTTIEKNYAFYCLFHSYDSEKTCGIVNAKDMSLPATTLRSYCYSHMFKDCTSLITAPELPATTLARYCYESMFSGCTSLVIAPELPATTLAIYCYSYMFKDCTSLTTIPDELPATTLTTSCYQQMFKNCTALTTAPKLPAITLANYCYYNMFDGCTSLNYIKAMFTTTPGTTYTQNWVTNVAANGTFVKNSEAQWTTSGDNGVPSGWTVQTASA